ncbi:hypothetical protein U1Q18_032956, partial [Sarracenia purpurea var. burkii]
ILLFSMEIIPCYFSINTTVVMDWAQAHQLPRANERGLGRFLLVGPRLLGFDVSEGMWTDGEWDAPVPQKQNMALYL